MKRLLSSNEFIPAAGDFCAPTQRLPLPPFTESLVEETTTGWMDCDAVRAARILFMDSLVAGISFRNQVITGTVNPRDLPDHISPRVLTMGTDAELRSNQHNLLRSIPPQLELRGLAVVVDETSDPPSSVCGRILRAGEIRADVRWFRDGDHGSYVLVWHYTPQDFLGLDGLYEIAVAACNAYGVRFLHYYDVVCGNTSPQNLKPDTDLAWEEWSCYTAAAIKRVTQDNKKKTEAAAISKDKLSRATACVVRSLEKHKLAPSWLLDVPDGAKLRFMNQVFVPPTKRGSGFEGLNTVLTHVSTLSVISLRTAMKRMDTFEFLDLLAGEHSRPKGAIYYYDALQVAFATMQESFATRPRSPRASDVSQLLQVYEAMKELHQQSHPLS